jgi:uncharacterized glyoxalase superfamily protein PhnB
VSTGIEPHLWVSNLSRSIAWYRDVLGLEPVNWYPSEDGATWCQMRLGRAEVMLAAVPAPETLADNQRYLAEVSKRVEGPGGALSMYLHVGDASSIHEAAVDGGATLIEDLWDPWWGGRQFTVADPDGNWWTVFESDAG